MHSRVSRRSLRHVINLQWNPDFWNTRFFETPDSSYQKSFPLDLLQSNTVILPPIFRMLDFSKLPTFRTLKTQEPTKTGFSHTHLNAFNKFRRSCFHAFFYYKASDKSVIEVIRNYNAVVTQSRVLNYCT